MDQEALEIPTTTVDQVGQMDSDPEVPEVPVDQEVQEDLAAQGTPQEDQEDLAAQGTPQAAQEDPAAQDTPQAVQEDPEIHTDHQTVQEHGISDHPRDIT